MNLATEISHKGKYDKDFDKWMSFDRDVAITELDSKGQGLPFLFRIHTLNQGGKKLIDFIEDKITAKVLISSLSREKDGGAYSLRKTFTDYANITNEEYGYILYNIKHVRNGRDRYINSDLIALFDLLYLMEEKYKEKSLSYETVLTHHTVVLYDLNKDEAMELFSCLMRLADSN